MPGIDCGTLCVFDILSVQSDSLSLGFFLYSLFVLLVMLNNYDLKEFSRYD